MYRNRIVTQGISSTGNICQPESSVDTYATLKQEASNEDRTYAELILKETIGDEIEQNTK